MPRGEVHQSWGMLQDAPSKASMTCPGTLEGDLHPLELIVPQARHAGSSGKCFPRPLWPDGASLHRFLLPFRMCLSPFCERRLETLPPSMKSIFTMDHSVGIGSNIQTFYPLPSYNKICSLYFDDESEYSPELMSHTKRPSA